MLAIVGGEWTPGKNTPFDPTAARAAAGSSHIRVIFAEGHDLSNLARILAGADFTGTTIGPQVAASPPAGGISVVPDHPRKDKRVQKEKGRGRLKSVRA